jgi:thiol-disulfide isomerase/thioredoxin
MKSFRDVFSLGLAAGLLLVASTRADYALSQEAESAADIESIDAESFAALVEANRGRVLVVNFWATWCIPCLKEVPELVELERALSPKGLVVVGVSLDDPDARAEVVAFRNEWFPEFRTYHTAIEDWYELIGIVEPEWPGVLPTSVIIDRSGSRADTLVGGKDYADFAASIEPLL